MARAHEVEGLGEQFLEPRESACRVSIARRASGSEWPAAPSSSPAQRDSRPQLTHEVDQQTRHPEASRMIPTVVLSPDCSISLRNGPPDVARDPGAG